VDTVRREAPTAVSRPAPTTLAFHASRIITDIGVLFVMAAMSLSFVNSPSGGRSAMELDALPTLILVAPIFLVTLIPDHTRPIPRYLGWGSLVLGLAALPYSIVKYLDAAVLADTLGGSLGLGARLLVFGTFVCVVGISIGLARVWMGLPTGGTPSRRAAITTKLPEGRRRPRRAPGAPPGEKPRPQRAATEESPFADPLFDSLEIPAAQSGDDLLDALDIPLIEPLGPESESSDIDALGGEVDQPVADADVPDEGDPVVDVESAAERVADDDAESGEPLRG
jgi:hypothetical protein